MKKVLSVLSSWCRACVYVLPVAAVLSFTACDEKGEGEVEIPAKLDIPEESLSYFKQGINFSATAADGDVTIKLSFTSSLEWSVTIEDANEGKPITWLTVNPSSGSAGPTTITITAQDNTDEQPRKAKITITCGSITQSVYVIQAGMKKEASTTLPDPAPAGSVNLGLSVYWATSNLSQSGLCANASDYGDFYAWGEVEPHYSSGYYTSTYKWYYNSNKEKVTKYCNKSTYWGGTGEMDNKTVLDPEDDAAHAILQGKWRMPTAAEWQELIDNCTWTWTDNYNDNGIVGIIFTGNKTGFTDRSIFIPAAGDYYGTGHAVAGQKVWYWSSSVSEENSYLGLTFSGGWGKASVIGYDRYYGFAIRPVITK